MCFINLGRFCAIRVWVHQLIDAPALWLLISFISAGISDRTQRLVLVRPICCCWCIRSTSLLNLAALAGLLRRLDAEDRVWKTGNCVTKSIGVPVTGSVVELAALVGHKILTPWTSLGRAALTVASGASTRPLLGPLDRLLAQMLHIAIAHHLDLSTEKMLTRLLGPHLSFFSPRARTLRSPRSSTNAVEILPFSASQPRAPPPRSCAA